MAQTTNPITRKAGPLPVWGWAVLALALWFLFLRGGAVSAGTAATGLPFTPASTGSAAPRPASGQGSAADNASGDLLAALQANGLSSDALLTALQGSGGSGIAAANGGGAANGGTAAATAPTVVDSGVTPDPPSNTGTLTPAQAASNPGITGTVIDPGSYSYAPAPTYTAPDAVIGNVDFGGQFGGVTSPTPYATVQPAPVDTTSPTVAPPPPPTLGKAVLV